MGRVGRFGGVAITGWGVGIRCRWGGRLKSDCVCEAAAQSGRNEVRSHRAEEQSSTGTWSRK